MRRHSIVRKLFVVTSVLILIVFSLVMLAEGLFFERFYRISKIHALERNMNEFADRFGYTEPDKRLVSPLLGAFMNQNDASIAVLNGRFERETLNPYYLELQTEGQRVTILISTSGMTMDAIPKGLQLGDKLTVDGIFMDEKDTILHPVAFGPTNQEPELGMVRVTGNISEVLLPEQRSYNPLYQDALIDDALNGWVPEAETYLARLQAGSVVHAEWMDEWSGVEYAVLIRSLPAGKDGDLYLLAMTSLQPVGEAVGILKQYVVYIAPIIVVLVILLSMIYSKIVSRPLVQLSRSAERLARLDFTEHPEIQSKDEFGELSRNMTALSRNLDSALRELTRANVKMQEDMREKERSEELRKELIANISHELKTPLGIVKGFAEGLQDEVASDKRDRYLSLIVNEADRMNALIMDMLELSKFEAKAIQLLPRRLPLLGLIQKVADSFDQQLESRQLRIQFNADEGDKPFVTADARRIEQVVLNLLSNAIRHAEENSVITISVYRSSAVKVTTTIENVGSPIAEEDLSRIWDQFYRAERSRDRKSGGTGLGLAIVKHILELHESEYDVRNTNTGVAFSFNLNESREEPNEK
ncbi:sensor histidine kinase [Paenibacillus harenae]|uniref:histidine kinase n=1 Tax=Paenibacillus harenae TaxID=306543 RepID=A0ABT9U101_PAEHA|nr:HAMP domain-containing sensor histidine kinase [Paenibacillus harenae]MDQ0113326.1 signal transduction histidine kinase [Paenibacillus harenae]